MKPALKFFNIDLHVSVIADIRHILRNLGHEVVDWTLSGHAWVMGRTPDNVDVVNAANWKGIDAGMCDAFYRRYREELEPFDAFIVTYPPCFAMLYERWNKPIVVIAATRYEHPFGYDARKWEAFNEYLHRQREAGRLIPLANNRYDAAYAASFTGFDWPVIPSLCEYVDAPVRFRRPEYVLWGQFAGFSGTPGLLDRADALPGPRSLARLTNRILSPQRRGYTWSALAAYSGIVHVPYNASLMSLFEQYTSGFPLLFPSPEYLRALYAAHRAEGVLSQLSFNAIDGRPPGSAIAPLSGSDPNRYDDIDTVMSWIRLADYYDAESMPHIAYFGSRDDLAQKIATLDGRETSARMKVANARRKERVYGAWRSVLETVAERI